MRKQIVSFCLGYVLGSSGFSWHLFYWVLILAAAAIGVKVGHIW